MPNWVRHKVEVKGNKDRVYGFKINHIKEDIDGIMFDFSTVIKMPETVYTGSLGEKERKKYGSNNWYDWSIKNWGTKWNSAHTSVRKMVKTETGYVLRLEFDTAWSTPIPVIKELAKMYPDLQFDVQFADEDIGSNCGFYSFDKNGADVTFLDDEGLAKDVWGITDGDEYE